MVLLDVYIDHCYCTLKILLKKKLHVLLLLSLNSTPPLSTFMWGLMYGLNKVIKFIQNYLYLLAFN
jgi:hypothetical protein